MTGLHLASGDDPIYRFKDGARLPRGVTAEGVMQERAAIADQFGYVTAQLSAALALDQPDRFPTLRAFGPATADEALITAMEEGVRAAYRSVVQVVIEDGPHGQKHEVELRVFHAVPTEATTHLTYEPITVIRRNEEQKSFLITELRRDARTFAQKLEHTLAELEYWDQ